MSRVLAALLAFLAFACLCGAQQAQTPEEAAAARNRELTDHFNRGLGYMQNHQYAQAISELNRAAALDPSQYAVWANLGEANAQLAKTKTGNERTALLTDAVEAHRQAVLLKPNDGGAHNNFALALALAGRLSDAEVELAASAQLDPANAGRYYFNLGAILTNSGQTAAAIRAFRKATQADSNYAEAYYQLGLALMSTAEITANGIVGDPEAAASLQKYLQLSPDGPNAASAASALTALGASNPASTRAPAPVLLPPARGVQTPVRTPPATPSGSRYALIIGNDQYRLTAGLRTARNDARQVEEVLRLQYGFATQLLLDATRDQILGALNQYRGSLTAESSLLIYYAGHGYFDKDSGRAYWFPVDADPNDNSHWISADDITSDIRALPARHVLVVADSCYSGALSRDIPISTRLPSGDRTRYLEALGSRGPARVLLSSGGNEPVADSGGDGAHSVFASAFVQGLNQMTESEFTVEELFSQYIQERVAGHSDQVPECSPLRNSGHDSGTFIFERSPVH